MEFICKIAGGAGAGAMITSRLMIKCFTRGGYQVIGYPEYPSLVRGGHNVVQIRISDKPVPAPVQRHELLIALNKDAIFYHMSNLSPGGAMIYDESIDPKSLEKLPKFKQRTDIKMCPVPLAKLAQEAGATEQMKNVAALAAGLALIDYPFEMLEQLIKDEFGRKGDEVVRKNITTAHAGYDYIKKGTNKLGKTVHPISKDQRIIITGNEAIALGAIKAGCKFYSAYPMTPASTILHYFAENERTFGVVAKQTEDEIAAINYAIGASFAGVRAMTGTSGGGFSLMVEALGMAAISETPIVVIISQRTGPSTGMPTWTEQGDLRFAMHASQGEFSRIVLSPGDVQECFFLTAQAHNLAEVFQVPVIVLSDKFLSESVFSTDKFDESKIKIERGKIVGHELPPLAPMTRWTRYKFSDDGVSERALPGTKNGNHVATSYEHEENGSSSELFTMRTNQVNKRGLQKVNQIIKRMDGPKIYGPKKADVTLVGWGSTKLLALDALALLEAKGITANLIHFTWLMPLDAKKVQEAFSGAKIKIMVENNSTAQFAGVLKEYADTKMDFHLLKYDGRPFFPEQIANEVEKLKKAGFKGNRDIRIVESEDLEYYAPSRYGL